MKLTVIIATHGRKALLSQALAFLERQTRLPDEVVVSAPDESHVEPRDGAAYPLTWVFGARGLCAQRNKALDHALARADIVTFFDDDFLPASNYLEVAERSFAENPGWAVLRGEAVVDGAKGAGLTFAEGVAALRDEERRMAQSPPPSRVSLQTGGYGCNMSVRAEDIGPTRFDERLPLYGWQEDIDFTSQLKDKGKIVGLNTLYGVHLGVKSGRVSGVRLGYSQLVNPVYLVRKGTLPSRFALNLIWRNIAANLAKSFWPEPYIDRRGRLKGNALAALHLVRGKIEPEYILKL